VLDDRAEHSPGGNAMRIGFDVSQTAEARAGCGVFQHELCHHLAKVAPEATLIPYPVFEGYRNPEFKRASRPEAPNVLPIHHDLSWHAINAGWDSVGSRHDFLGRPDVVHANSFSCPQRIGAPLVYTVYDLSPIEHPEYHTEENRLVCFNGLFDASLHADAFVAISAFTRERFLHWFPHVNPERVTIVYPAARSSVVASVSAAVEISALRRFALEPDGFWLAVGTIEPRKNYSLLLEAYARLLQSHPESPDLCIAGQPGWKESSLEARSQALGVTNRVRFLGFVPDAELAALYRHCVGFVYPSHYEGFGLPVIEALAAGAPVLASDTTSLPEVLGDAGILFDHTEVEHLASAMTTLLIDTDCRARLRANARIQASRFSWKEAATRVRQVYESVCLRARAVPAAAEPVC
jgi:glycosyltransferase involved in cell wall biosynthesis